MKQAQQVSEVPLSQLRENPNNPRKIFGPVDDLAKSIATQGVVQPVIYRRKDDHLELIFGHRRLRAAKLAGLKTIPGIEREMTDAQVLEAQLVENLQREDIHRMEQAEGFGRLRDEFGYSVDRIAEQVGTSRASIYAALKLLDLVPGARAEFYAGRLQKETALLIARLKGENLQMRAVDLVTKPGPHGELPSTRAAAALLEKHFSSVKEKAAPKRIQPHREAAKQEKQIRQRTARLVMARAVETIEKRRELESTDLRLMLQGLAGRLRADAVLERRGIETEEQLEQRARKMDAHQLRGLLFELAMAEWIGDVSAELTPEVKALSKAFGVDIRDAERAARAQLEQEEQRDHAEALFQRQ
jgi:ParB/RepB/Spo0J family partition protein